MTAAMFIHKSHRMMALFLIAVSIFTISSFLGPAYVYAEPAGNYMEPEPHPESTGSPFRLKPFPLLKVPAGKPFVFDTEPYIVRGHNRETVRNSETIRNPEKTRVLVIAPRDCPATADGHSLTIEPASELSGLLTLTILVRSTSGKQVMGTIPVLVTPAMVTSQLAVPSELIGASVDSTVSAAGSFNGWDPSKSPLTFIPGTDTFSGSLTTEPGAHPYKLVVDGQWIPDPSNPRFIDDGFGGKNSLLEAGTAGGELRFLPLSRWWSRKDGGWRYQAEMLLSHVSAPKGTAGMSHPLLDIVVIAGDRVLLNPAITLTPWRDKSWKLILDICGLKDSTTSFSLAAAVAPGLPCTEYRWSDSPEPLSPSSNVLYFAMTDRFINDNRDNDRPVIDFELFHRANYQGGDFAGITGAIRDGYFNRLGVDWIWISPVIQGPGRAYRDALPPHRKFSGYHGYWPVDIWQPEPRFGTLDELKELVAAAHGQGLKIMFDAVFNHLHQNSAPVRNHPEWFVPLELGDGTSNIRKFDEHPLTTWFDNFLPSFDYARSPEARRFMVENALWWIESTGIDGFRLDAVKHIPRIFWEDLRRAIKDRYPDFLMIGETISGRREINRYLGTDCLDGQFDFPLYFTIRDTLACGRGTMEDVENAIRLSETTYPAGSAMSPLLGNHDFARFTAFADGDIKPGDDEKEIGWERPPEVEDYRVFERLRVAFGLIMTLPGYPLIYYGDEYGMSGGGDPDNRRPMRFAPRRSKAEQATADFVSLLCNLRRRHRALRSEARWPVLARGDILAYARYDFNSRVLVVLNRSDKIQPVSFALPPGFPDRCRLQEEIRGETFRITDGNLHMHAAPRSISVLVPSR